MDWAGPGFHGKLPARGDFVTRGLPAAVVDAVDGWLQDALAASRDRLGGGWLDLYLNCPVWHFAATDLAATGLLIPSVDRVGRYFPLLVAAPLPGGDPLSTALTAAGWRRRAEAAALLALDATAPFERFEAAVAALGCPEAAEDDPLVRWSARRPELAGAAALWWTAGSDRVAPVLAAFRTVPPPESFACLLDGEWSRLDGAAVTVINLGAGS